MQGNQAQINDELYTDEERWAELRTRVAQAASRSQRSADDITVIAVSKTVSATRVRQAYLTGWQNFGENRVQELVGKQDELVELPGATWHLIGQLQSNKVKDVLGRVSYIHSLDRLSLAIAIQERAENMSIARMKCFIEMNLAGETSKAGLAPNQLPDFLRQVSLLPRLEIVGLMTIPPLVSNPEESRALFRRLAEMRDQIREMNLPSVPMNHLSMGMSADFEIAIEEGADFIRVGTAIFGRRTI